MRNLRIILIKILLIFSLMDLHSQAIFTVPNVTPNTGESFCVDVTAENLTDVLSMQFSINWDPSVATFTGLNNIAAPFATANVTPNVNAGQVSFSWFSGSATGSTLPANAVLFELCFTMIGNTGASTNIDFTSNPTFIEVTTLGSGGANIGITVVGGNITVPTVGQPVIFTLPDVMFNTGASFCIPVEADNIVDIISMQFTIDWDPTVIQFDSVTAFNMPQLGIADFGLSNVSTGNIAFSWFDNTLNGVTVPNNTEIFEICFTIIGNPNDVTQVAFTNDPVPVEVIEGNNDSDVGLIPQGGVVTVLQSLFITNADIEGTSCANPEVGSIDITVAGGLGTYTYLWSNGEITEDLMNLTQGFYTVTISDSNNPPNTKIETYTVLGDFQAPIANAGMDTLINCNDPLLVLDGTGSGVGTDIIYLWTTSSTGTIQNETTITPSVNAIGLYTLLVTDTLNGCTAMDDMIVGGTAIPPVVDAGLGGEITCQNTTTTLNGSVNPTSTDYTYQWTNLTTGNIVNGATTLSTTVSESGLYELLITDASGCSAFDTVSVIANTALPIADAGTTMVLDCENTEVTLDASASASGTNITYFWSNANGAIIQNSTTVTPTVSEVGTYEILVTNTLTNCNSTATVEVTQNTTPPFATATSGGAIDCLNSTVTLDGTGSSTGNSFIYEWTSMDGNIASGGTTLMPIADDDGIYILTVTDTVNHCTATASSEVTINGTLPTANAGPDRIINCEIDTVQLDGSDSSLGTGYAYEWTTDNGNIISGGDFVIPLVNAGGQYTLTVTDTINFCSSISTVTVEVDTISPVAQIDASEPLTCSTTELTLTNQNSSSGVGFSFGWFTNDGSIINATPSGDPIINGPGTYEVIVTNSNNQCTNNDFITIAIDTISPIANAGSDIVLTCSDTLVNLDGASSSSGNDFTYNWTTSNGNILLGNETLAPQINDNGIYHLEVIDTTNGCFMIDSVEVTKDENFPLVNAGPNGILNCITPQTMLNGTASTNTGVALSLEWTTMGTGHIVSGITTLTPTVDGPGLYTLTATNIVNQCSSSDVLIVSSNLNVPIADAGQNAALICDTTEVLLDGSASSSGSNIEYSWTTSNGNIITDTTLVNITVDAGGIYELLVTDLDNGCTAEDIVIVTQDNSILPVSIVEAASNLNCNNPTVVLDGSTSTISANQTFEWMGNGNFSSGVTTLTPTVDEAGFYSLIITDNVTGCTSQSSAFILIDTMTPMATATANNSITCDNNMVTIDGTGSTTGQFIIYEWSTANGSIDSDSSLLTIDVSAGGSYQLMVQDTVNGCSTTLEVMVESDTISPIANVGGTLLELLCSSDPTFLNGSASSTGTEYDYAWTSIGGTIVNGVDGLMPEINGAGIYTLEVINTSNGCTATNQIQVTEPEEVIALAEANAQLDCSSSSVVLDGNGSSNGNNIVYLWTTTDGNLLSGETTLNPEIDAAGIYILSVANIVSGCTATTSVEVVFSNSFPAADAGQDMMTCEDNNTLAANLPAGATGLWLTSGGAIPNEPGNPNTTVTNLQEGSNILVWTLSAPGCPEYSVDSVTIMLENTPSAVDDNYSILQNSGVFDFNTLNNDSGANAILQAISGVANGSLTPLGNGDFTYTPNEDFIGTEMFDYELCSELCPDVCELATVTISVNEIPMIDPDSVMVKYNAITPNGDGLNDVFIFDFIETNPDQFPDNELVVFNRWGDIVYQAKPYNNDWAGTNQKGTDLPQGTYYYILRLDITERLILKGDVTILK